MKILLSWSSGKDSAWALHLLNQQYPGAVQALLTTVNEAVDRVAMHAVRREVLEAQARAAGRPLVVVPIPHPCPNEIYEERMRAAVAAAVADGFTHVAFGDLFLEDVRRYRVDRLAGTGLEPLFPVWGIPTAALAEEMVATGLRARVACVDTRVLDASFVGREFDRGLLADLPAGIDPCGENGEFHTCVYAGPMFSEPLILEPGEIVTKEPFVWRDLGLGSERGQNGVRVGSDPSEDRTQLLGMNGYPSRIVCLTEETTETLYLLGEGDRVVGVSGYTVRPPEARKKPRVSAFIHAKYDRIEALEPDLILGFSDLQANIAAELIKRGYPVMVFNQRSVPEILEMIRILGGLVGCPARADWLVSSLELELDAIRAAAAQLPTRPRVFFEEWDEPLISGIRWVEELVDIAGGDTIFPELRDAKLGKQRIVTSEEVIRRRPDVIIASWCGKAVRREKIVGREGWGDVPAVRDGHIYEIKSAYILQPGPAALTEGIRQIHHIISRVARAMAGDAQKDRAYDSTSSGSGDRFGNTV
jgi:iron complex transport system substrate-binding protein